MFDEAIFWLLSFYFSNCILLSLGLRNTIVILTLSLGDSLYPETEDTPSADIEEEDFSSETTLKNRIQFSSPNLFRIGCNIVDPSGHKQPRDFAEEIKDSTLQSKM